MKRVEDDDDAGRRSFIVVVSAEETLEASFRPGKKLGRGTFFLDRPQWQQRGCNRFEVVASPETTSRWGDGSLVFRTLLFSGLSS